MPLPLTEQKSGTPLSRLTSGVPSADHCKAAFLILGCRPFAGTATSERNAAPSSRSAPLRLWSSGPPPEPANCFRNCIFPPQHGCAVIWGSPPRHISAPARCEDSSGVARLRGPKPSSPEALRRARQRERDARDRGSWPEKGRTAPKAARQPEGSYLQHPSARWRGANNYILPCTCAGPSRVWPTLARLGPMLINI